MTDDPLAQLKLVKKEHFAHILIGVYVVIAVLVQGSMLGDLQSLPSPMYGGDYYYQMGSIHHLVNGGAVMDGANVAASGLPGYLPVYGLLAAFLVKIGLSVFGAMKVWSLLSLVIGIVFTYLTLWRLNRSQPFVNVLLTVLFAKLLFVWKYTAFAEVALAPLWMFFLVIAFQERKPWAYLVLGCLTGLGAFAHSSLFFTALLIPLYLFVAPYLRSLRTPKRWVAEFKGSWKQYLLFIVPSLLISFVYWFKPLFVFEGVVNEQLKWSFGMFYSANGRLAFLWSIVKSFFKFSSVSSVFITLFVLLGIVFLIWRKKDEQLLFVQRFSVAYLLVLFSYFITIPLFDAHFAQGYVYAFFHVFLLLLLAVVFFTSAEHLMSEMNWKIVHVSLLALVLLLGVLQLSAFTSAQDVDQWFQAGKNEFDPSYTAFGAYAADALDVDDVVLSTKELSFALHAFSGVKTVTSRWAQQNNQFVSMTDLDLAAAIMLYGNNSAMTKEYLETHGVDYVFWHAYWIQSEFSLDQQGNIVGPFDPLRVLVSDERESLLTQAQVPAQMVEDYLDPTSSKYSPTFEMFMVVPNYRSYAQPWAPALDDFLEPVWKYPASGQAQAVLYKVTT